MGKITALIFLFISLLIGIISITNIYYASIPNQYFNLSCPFSNITTICNQPIINLHCPNCTYNCPNLTYNPCFHTETIYTSHFQEVVASTKIEKAYAGLDWNCDEMSLETKKRLNNAGYNCNVKCGWYDDTFKKEKHCWVECNVIIEATTGEIVQAINYKNYIK